MMSRFVRKDIPPEWVISSQYAHQQPEPIGPDIDEPPKKPPAEKPPIIPPDETPDRPAPVPPIKEPERPDMPDHIITRGGVLFL